MRKLSANDQQTAYFWPAQVFAVTTYGADYSQVDNASGKSTETAKRAFVPSSLDIDEFEEALANKLNTQFAGSTLPMPRVLVEKVDAIYQINLRSGAVQYGNFLKINTPDIERYQLEELNNVVADVWISLVL